MRRLVFYELRRDPERLAEIAERSAPALAARLGRAALPYSRAFTALRYGAGSAQAADHAREKVLMAVERLEAELGDGDYLAAGRFTVADLTAASLLYPLVLPPQAPTVSDAMPAAYERFRAPLRERRGYRWVAEMFDRHRRPGDEPVPAAQVQGAERASAAR
jgi:glutathione S-transferase